VSFNIEVTPEALPKISQWGIQVMTQLPFRLNNFKGNHEHFIGKHFVSLDYTNIY
jgi:hypothetical protein